MVKAKHAKDAPVVVVVYMVWLWDDAPRNTLRGGSSKKDVRPQRRSSFYSRKGFHLAITLFLCVVLIFNSSIFNCDVSGSIRQSTCVMVNNKIVKE